jgi:RES domain-containing protein
MLVYRLTRERFAHTLSGKGAAIKGGRWNSVGVELLYTASNSSLAMAEVAVHLTLATLPADFMMVSILIPDSLLVQEIPLSQLPTNWQSFPHPSSTQVFGDQFVAENKSCVLKIPSVVTQGDFNFLINPNHPDFAKVEIQSIEKFPFDQRIFK